MMDLAFTHEKVATTEWNATSGIPRFALQEVLGVVNKQIFDARIENDGVERPLRTGGDMTPIVAPVINEGFVRMSIKPHNM